jgi:LPS export ABC transporter protein LptC
MTSWQKRVRLGLAIFGVVFAGLVYSSIGERKSAAPPSVVDRLDPKAILETTAAVLQQVRGSEQEFEIKSDRTLSYEDGSAKHFNVEITVRRPDGRTFVITAQEALAGPNQVQLQLTGEVRLAASDGFRLLTDRATFNQNESVARVPGALTFTKGPMAGAGIGATYDQRNDVLQIMQQATVTMTDGAGKMTMDGTAGTATLDRLQDVLFLDSGVHVLRDAQVIDADHAMARLSAGEEVITHLELRGNSRVHGGAGSIESMQANAIDLDYTDDGKGLERVLLNGGASAVMTADEQASGRRMTGDSLDFQLAGDGTLTGLTGREAVHLELPASGGAPARSIRARILDASGEPGRGLTVAQFRDQVIYREEGGRGVPSREAHSQTLKAALDGDGVTDAYFTGSVTFVDQGLRASAAEASYQPEKNTLNLTGTDAGGEPTVTDEQIRVEARTIDVTLEGHTMAARGNVRTSLKGRTSESGRREQEEQGGRLPSLLRQGEAASVNAETLDYRGAEGRAVYSRNATLVQGDTAIRGDVISLDRQKGDLVATGSARSTLVLDGGRTDGRADEIRYDEAARLVTYSMTAVAPTSGKGVAPTAGGAPAAAPGRLAQLSGPQGDLRAGRIQIVLARDGNQVERLEGDEHVTMIQGPRTAVGARLTYHAREERYVMSGSGVTPVTIRESCRETTGRTLTFFKSTDRIVVDGDGTGRTETRPCTSEPSR